VPSQDGFWPDDLRHFGQGFPAQPLADLGQRDALVVRQAGPTFELFPKEAVLGGQILISQEQFLIDRPSDISQQTFPIHRPKVNQRLGWRSKEMPSKSLQINRFDFLDLTRFTLRHSLQEFRRAPRSVN
jgi:hypothetical protein